MPATFAGHVKCARLPEPWSPGKFSAIPFDLRRPLMSVELVTFCVIVNWMLLDREGVKHRLAALACVGTVYVRGEPMGLDQTVGWRFVIPDSAGWSWPEVSSPAQFMTRVFPHPTAGWDSRSCLQRGMSRLCRHSPGS